MRSMKILLIALTIITVFVACSPASIPMNNKFIIESQLLSFPTGYYDNIVYIDGRLVAFAEDPNKHRSERISFAYEGDSALHPFNPEKDATCVRYAVYYVRGGTLPDGRLGLVKECGGESLMDTNSIFAYDWKTGALEQLVKGPLPKGWSSKNYTWNPQMTRGVQEMVGSYQGTIYWLSPDEISPMDIELEDQGLKWNLKDYYEGKDRIGSVRFPAWSPDGTTIAFFASTYGIREEPVPKMNVKYELYLMDASELKPAQVVQGIANAFQLRWSPDNKHLLFSGCMGFQLQCALWIYNLESKSLTLVADGDFQDFTWITNEKIAAIKNIGETSFADNQIFEYVISEPQTSVITITAQLYTMAMANS